MPKFKPNQMAMIRGAAYKPINGKIVTLVKFLGDAKNFAEGAFRPTSGPTWQIDQEIPTWYCYSGRLTGRYKDMLQERYLVPLSDPDLSSEITKEKLDASQQSPRAVPTSHHHT